MIRPMAIAGFCFFLLLLGGAADSVAQETLQVRDVVERASPFVVTLRVFAADGSEIQQGSGFLLADGRIVTNQHVVVGGSRVEVVDRDGQLMGVVSHAEALSLQADLVLLPKIGNHDSGLEVVSMLPTAGDEVVVISSPEGLGNSVSRGIVSAIRDVDGKTLIQVTAAVSEGSSGGPVLDSTGRVVGVAVSTLRDGQNLNFAVPASSVDALAASPPGRYSFGISVASSLGFADEVRTADGFELIAVGETVEGSLGQEDIILDDGRRVDVYYFEGRSEETIRLEMRSAVFDTYAFLVLVGDDDYSVVAENDDAPNGTTNSEIVAELPGDGTYVILAAGYDSSDEGVYDLSLASVSDAESAISTSTPESANDASDEDFLRGPLPATVFVSEDSDGVLDASSLQVQLEERLRSASPITNGLIELSSAPDDALILFYFAPNCFHADKLTGGDLTGGVCAVGVTVYGQGVIGTPTLMEPEGETGDYPLLPFWIETYAVSGGNAESIQRQLAQGIINALESLPWAAFVEAYREWLATELFAGDTGAEAGAFPTGPDEPVNPAPAERRRSRGPILAGELPPLTSSVTPPTAITESASWTRRTSDGVEFEWSVVVSNANDVAMMAVATAVLRDVDGVALWEVGEAGSIPAHDTATVAGGGSIPFSIAEQASHWTIDVEWREQR